MKDDYGIFVLGDDLSINHGVLDHMELAALSLSFSSFILDMAVARDGHLKGFTSDLSGSICEDLRLSF